MLTRNRQTGMLCFFVSIALVGIGYGIWKKKKTDWIPGYKYKTGENTSAYCVLVGKGAILMGIGLYMRAEKHFRP